MHRRKFAVMLALGASFVLSSMRAQAQPEFFQVEDIRPGMKGVGKTCFQGMQPEDFEVEILGVVHGLEPGASAVLARLEGDQLDKIGVFEGMSGSPVFIDGKLLGAIAFTYAFAKEPICGITPITRMVKGFEEFALPKIEFHMDIRGSNVFPGAILPSPGAPAAVMEQALAAGLAKKRSEPGGLDGHTLIPIATPISMAGLDAKTLKVFQPQFQALGFTVIRGAGGAEPEQAADAVSKEDAAPLEPGSGLVVSLIEGDLDVSAGGTVTHVDGNKIYAFGHSLLDLGFTDLPIHKARTIVIFPSLQSSFKIMEMGETVGAIRQDRGMGIYGVLGEKASLMPLNVTLRNSRGVSREFKYRLARDRTLSPLLVNLAVYNTIAASERGDGVVTIDIEGQIKIENHEAIAVYNRFSSDSGVADAIALSAAVPVNYLMAFGYEDLNIESIDLNIEAREEDRSALLDSIHVNRMEAKAGDGLNIEISCKKANGETIRNVYPLNIPANVPPGPLSVQVADGTTMMSLEDEQTKDEILVPRDLSHLIQLINNIRKNDRLYVRMFRREPGAVVNGEGLPGLPPSMLSVLGSKRRDGAVSSLGVSSFLEYELPPMDYIAQGSKTLTINIKP